MRVSPKLGARFGCACAALVCLATLSACAGTPPAFSTRYPDNREADIEVLLQRIEAAGSREPGTVAVGVTAAPMQLFGFDLATKSELWRRPVAAVSEPMLAGDTVVIATDSAVEGYDLRSGNPRFSVSHGGRALRGAGGDGQLTVFALGEGMGTFARSEVILVRGGSTAWRRDVESQVGVPTVVGSQVLVPWSNQYLSAIDVVTGNELARVRVRDGVISHALRDRGNVYVGSQHGVTRVTASIGSGTLKGAGYLTLPAEDLPGRPLLLFDVYTQSTAQRPDSARHSIGLEWQPTTVDAIRIGMQDDNVYLRFYRMVFALSPKDYSVRWVHMHDHDLVGARAQPGGLVFGDQTGSIGFLGAQSGELTWHQKGKGPTTVMKLPRGGGGGAGNAPSETALRSRLLAAAQDTDARLVPGRLLAVKHLSRMPDAEATANLIALCDDDRLAPPVNKAACAALRDRTIGEDHLLTALERHAGYLEGTSSPPVGALARAAAAQGEKRAVPLLLAHLKDPGTRSRDLAPMVQSLLLLGDRSVAEPLSDFLQLYHADPIDEDLVKALELIPHALVKLSGPVAIPVLENVAYDELGSFVVRQKARIALGMLQEQQRAAEASEAKDQRQQEADAAAEPRKPAPNPADFRPTHLTTELVNNALLPVRDELQGCLKKAPKPVYQSRVVLVVEDGQVLMVSVLPKELQGCVEPLVRSQQFPRTRNIKKERLTYTLKRL